MAKNTERALGLDKSRKCHLCMFRLFNILNNENISSHFIGAVKKVQDALTPFSQIASLICIYLYNYEINLY